MRFSMRDWLWGTLVVAMGLGWWVDHRQMAAKVLRFHGVRQVERYLGEVHWK
jgi:hypothetical protein